MIWRILARLCSDKLRTHILYNMMLESAWIRPNSSVELKLTIHDSSANTIDIVRVSDNRFEATLGKEKD